MSKAYKYNCDICGKNTNNIVRINRKGIFNFMENGIVWREYNGHFDVCHECWKKLAKQIKEMK